MSASVRSRLGLGATLLVLSVAVGCDDAHQPCDEALAADDPTGSAEICRAAWGEMRDGRAAVGVARALVAEKQYDEALAWIDDRLDEGHTGDLRIDDLGDGEKAVLHRSAASAALRLGDDERSKAEYAAALELFRRIGDVENEGKCHYGLFYLYWRDSELGRALVHADGAAAAARRAGDEALESKALGGLLALQYDLGDLPGARRTLQASRAREDTDDATTRARSLVFEGTLLADEQRPELAVDAFERALDLATGEEEAAFFRSCHLNLTAALLELGRTDEAWDHLTSAKQYATTGNSDPESSTGVDPTVAASLGLHEAALELARDRPQEALGAVRTALDVQPIADWRWQLQELAGRALEALGRVAEAEAAYSDAIDIVEAMRADLDYGELRSWLLDAKRRPHERLFLLQVREGRLREALATVERAKARSFLDAFVQSTRPAAGAPTEQTARRLDGLRDLLPALSAAPITRLEPLNQVLAATSDLDVLIYFQTPEGLWAVTVYEGSPAVRRLGDGAAKLGALVDAWQSEPDNQAAAESLGRLLLPEDLLPPSGRRLHVVADGRVGEVSLAALPILGGDSSGGLLLERNELIYSPGLNALAALLALEEGPDDTPTGGPESLVLGDPLGDLPGARREAQRVAQRLGTEARVGADATLESLAPGGAEPPLLHLATHLGSGPEGPWLVLADGRLTAAELIAGGSAPRRVVLAGCAGAARQGRGLWGSVAVGFLAAGSSTVLAALWSIDDEWTLRFVERFYEEGGDDDPVGATARAQRYFQMRGDPAERWAPFVVLGASRPSS